MSNLKIFLFPFIIASLLFTNAYSQNKDEKKGDEIYQYGQYSTAIDFYKSSFTKETDKKEKAIIIFKIAQCYRLISDAKNAEIWYKKAMTANYSDHIVTLYYADMLLANGKIDEATTQYNSYLELEPSDQAGMKGIESCKLVLQWEKSPTNFEVVNCNFLNSKDDDYAPSFYNLKYNSLIFSSSRESSLGNIYNPVNGQCFADIYLSAFDKTGEWSIPASVGKNINTKDGESDACLYFNEKSLTATPNELYFTRSIVEKNKKLVSHIFVSKLKNGSSTEWDTPILIPIATDSVNCCNPFISTDGLTLFFSSDMQGGQGGMDLWMIKRNDKSAAWAAPVNFGATINTTGDEVYPYMNAGNDTLYFSSNGLPGMGGLDIFMAVRKENSWETPVNMQYPINSTFDDFGIIFQNNRKGYFSSNRLGGKGGFDIYTFSLPQH